MKWYKKLYYGENARKVKYKIFGKIAKSRLTFDTFLIMLPSNKENLLDIMSADVLKQPHFKNKKIQDSIYIVGIAKGKEEALEVVRVIIDEVYQATKGFDIPKYLHFGNEKRM